MIQLTLSGHDDRYAVEQLLLSLFPEGAQVQAVSALHRGQTWLTATAKIALDGRTVSASRRIRAAEETVRLRRRALQQSVYLAAVQLLPQEPAWGALAGVRPTKLTTKCLLEGGTPKSAEKLLKDVYFVTPQRRRLAVDCSVSTVEAVHKTQPSDVSVYVGIPFCPTRCAYCSFVSRTVGKKAKLMEPYLEALLKEKFIMPMPDYDGEVRYILNKLPRWPQILFSACSDYAIINMVTEGLGVSILPELLLKNYGHSAVALPMDPPQERMLGMGVPQLKTASPVTRNFMEYVKRYVLQEQGIQ